MSESIYAYQLGEEAPKPRKGFWKRILASKIIMLSIAIHLLFGVGATYLIIQSIQAKRKLTFQGGPGGATNPSTRALEHQINMARRQQTMSAPAQAKRITTTGLAKITLPDMPSLSTADDFTPDKMAGMGGVGTGFGMGGGGGGGGGNGRGVTLFGMHEPGSGLKGTFWDLKQTPGRQPTRVKDIRTYAEDVASFVNGGWNIGSLSRYYKSPVPLYANQIFIPRIVSENAPAAFGVQREVKPSFWMAIYEGDISPPEDGTYHFVGGADNVLIVRLDGEVVLKDSWNYNIMTSWRPDGSYVYHFLPKGDELIPPGFGRGRPMNMQAGKFYHIQVLLGDDGGVCHFSLLVQKEGVDYPRTRDGVPYFPILRFAEDPPPPGEHPPFVPNGPIWQSRASSSTTSPFSDMDALLPNQ
jgi:hypothetical protein